MYPAQGGKHMVLDLDRIPDPETVAEAKLAAAVNLKPLARRLALAEMNPSVSRTLVGDDTDNRDLSIFLDNLTTDITNRRRFGQYPVTPFDAFSRTGERPRSRALLEALKFLVMRG